MEIIMEVPQKLKIELPYDPAIPPLGIYKKKYKSAYNQDSYIPMFIAALLTHYHQTMKSA
jgi:hypothetical protein